MSITRALLEFLDVPAAASWDLAPEEAVAFAKAKGLSPSFDYRDLLGSEHARAFTVAKMMDTDLLADVKDSLDAALASGVPFREWADSITPMLQSKGWWGRKKVTDPLTGETILADLGTPSRLQTIYRTNMQSAYAAGAWDAIQANADQAPFLLYDAVDDHRVRPEHAAWDGTVLEVTDAWWQTHYPPNGWNCRCSVIQLSAEDLADLGMAPGTAPPLATVPWNNPRTGRTRQVPKGVDPGWDYNVGAERAKALAKTVAEKLGSYPPGFSNAAAAGMAAAKEAGAAAFAAEVAAGQLALAKEMGSAALTRATMKAAERSAAWQLEDALASKTPYLAKSIKDLQKTKAGQAMGPGELLAAAKVQAEKLNQQTALSDWKKAYLAGKAPPVKAQAAFDALPDDAAQALKAQLDTTKAAAAAETAAQAEFQTMLGKSTGSLEAKAAAKVLQAAAPDAKFTQLLADAQADVAAAKAKQVAAQVQAGLLKSLASGKQLTPAQAALFDSLPDQDKAALFFKADEIKQASLAKTAAELPPASAPPGAVPVTAPSTLNPDKLVQIGPQKGSNPGGLYRDTDTGEQWYIKTPPSAEHARNEVLAGKLYQLAGVDTPELRLTTLNGQPAVASRIVDGLTKADAEALAGGFVDGVHEGFAVDAWLANWDVVGAGFDNLLVKGWSAFRVDTGGALRFRAQGGLKGSAWGDSVTELDSLRQAATNPQAAAVFGSITSDQLAASAAKLLKVDRKAMDQLVDQFGPADLAEREALKRTLAARLDDIAKRLGIAPEPVRAPPAPLVREGGKTISATDLDRVTESRGNGYTVSTDGGDIEDHQVLLQHYTSADGTRRTRLVAKLRGEGAKRALDKIEPNAASGAPLLDFAPMREKTLALAKSINSRAAKGGTWDETIELRVKEFNAVTLKALDALDDLGLVKGAEHKAVRELVEQVAEWKRLHVRGPGMPEPVLKPIAQLDLAKFTDVKRVPVDAKPGALAWSTERRFEYNLATFDKGHMRETARLEDLPAVSQVMEARADGLRVRFIADTDANSVSSRGLVHVDVDGTDLAAAERAIATLADLGVTTTRTTQGERTGQYLDKLANLRTLRNADLEARYAKLASIGDEAERNAAKLAMLSKDAGYDLTTSPHWNPDGLYQAFGHGRTLQMRPDLDTPEMRQFEERATVYTNVTGLGIGASDDQWERLVRAIDGGGILSSQMERARRGIPSTGSSVQSDHNSGGANYIFTRLLSKRTTAAGVYFKPRILRRADAFSNDRDVFGRVSRSAQREARAVDAKGFLNNIDKGGNETNFRDGISLFDDLERIIFRTVAERKKAIADMRARGYTTWPDGRALEDVLQGPTR